MKRDQAVKQLAEIAGIREVQRMRAETDAMRAATVRAEKERSLSDCERRSRSAHENWLEGVSATSFVPELVHLLARHVIGSDIAVHNVAAEADRAAEELSSRATAFHRAQVRQDLARDAARSAADRDIRRIDEAALQDALDRHAQRRRVG